MKPDQLLPYIILAGILLPGMQLTDKRSFRVNLGSAMASLHGIRFLWAVLIIFTHCSQTFEKLPALYYPLKQVSTFGVGYFFTMSGYGLAHSVKTKPGYLKTIRRKVGHLLLVGLVCCLLHAAVRIAVSAPVTIWVLINWYLPVSIMFYGIFYVVYRFFGKTRRSRTVCLWLLVSALICTNYAIGMPRSYYISELAFPFGVLLYEYAEEIERQLHRKWFPAVLVLSLAITFYLAKTAPEKTVADLLSHNLMLMPTILLLIYPCSLFRFDNRILRFMNGRCLEIYLCQFPSMVATAFCFTLTGRALNGFYYLFSLALTCSIAIVIHTLVAPAGKAAPACAAR